MDIYVGNLPYSADEQTINDMFSSHGEVSRVKIITDFETGRSKGFAFVTMDNADEANAAIDALNGTEMEGRPLRINASREREERGPRRSFDGPPRRNGGGGGGGAGGFKPRFRQDRGR